MRMRKLALWPMAAPQPKPIMVKVETPPLWNQEEEKFRNEIRQVETPQEQLQRLCPYLNCKRLVL